MGHVNIYIRKDDVSKWDAIANKAEWLHDKLCDDDTKRKALDYHKRTQQAISNVPIEAPKPQTPKPSTHYTPKNDWGA